MNKENDNAREQGAEQPPFLTIVEGYLWGINGKPTGKHPATIDPKRTRVITSQEIVLELADMADMELNDVARCMSYLGYICGSWDGKIGWLVQIEHS